MTLLARAVKDLIRQRTSWRTYNGEKLSVNERESLLSFIESDMKPLFGSRLRFKLVDRDSGSQKMGTYGFIKDARHFIVGAVKPGDMNIEDYGYALERIILYSTGMGLGTCWMGGTFNKQGFLELLNPVDGEIMPAITPVGYVKKRRGTFGKAVRYFAGARNRKPWSNIFFKQGFTPLKKEDAGVFVDALELVRLAPSASNGQPWRVVLDGGSAHFYFKARKGYESMNRLDMGIAFCHFDLSLKEAGITGEWEVTDPNVVSSGLKYVATCACVNL